MKIGIDTGGTFTDFVLLNNNEIKVHKVLSTPEDPSVAIEKGLIQLLGVDFKDLEIYHGTTVATNALLERKGSRTVLITTKGFEDVIEIGRQNRDELYNIFVQKTEPLVSRKDRLGVDERINFSGKILKNISDDELQRLINKLKRLKPESIAVSLLHSYANNKHEKLIAGALRKLKIPLTLSSELVPEFREYERTSTVVINAYLSNKVKSYMENLDTRVKGSKLSVLQSNGGLINTRDASREAVRILISGPAGGVIGAHKIAAKIGVSKIITYDMGGTSTDVSLCDGGITFTNINKVDNLPVNIPMIDVHTIGAGGGSIAYMDKGGVLKVGPESAGSDPGPACYGKGVKPTVTDANLVLGRIRSDYFLSGNMKISDKRAISSIKHIAKKLNMSIQEAAEGTLAVANSNMEKALRVISLERGYDPRDFSLISFGGAGGLHACEISRNLEMKSVIFPVNPGVLSAMGMLVADYFRDASKSVFIKNEDGIYEKILSEYGILIKKLASNFAGKNIKLQYFIDARYKRQSHELIIPFSKNFVNIFHREHKKMYGYSKPESIIEIVNIRLRGIINNPGFDFPELKVESGRIKKGSFDLYYDGKKIKSLLLNREQLYPDYIFKGPAVIMEPTSTLFIPPGFKCIVDNYGNITATTL